MTPHLHLYAEHSVLLHLKSDGEDLFAFGGGVGTGHQEPAVAEWFLSCLILFVYCIADEGTGILRRFILGHYAKKCYKVLMKNMLTQLLYCLRKFPKYSFALRLFK